MIKGLKKRMNSLVLLPCKSLLTHTFTVWNGGSFGSSINNRMLSAIMIFLWILAFRFIPGPCLIWFLFSFWFYTCKPSSSSITSSFGPKETITPSDSFVLYSARTNLSSWFRVHVESKQILQFLSSGIVGGNNNNIIIVLCNVKLPVAIQNLINLAAGGWSMVYSSTKEAIVLTNNHQQLQFNSSSSVPETITVGSANPIQIQICNGTIQSTLITTGTCFTVGDQDCSYNGMDHDPNATAPNPTQHPNHFQTFSMGSDWNRTSVEVVTPFSTVSFLKCTYSKMKTNKPSSRNLPPLPPPPKPIINKTKKPKSGGCGCGGN